MLHALLWTTLALADTLTLAPGRVAVLAPQVVPTSLSVTAPQVIEVIPASPWLLVYAREAGQSRLTLTHESGERVWEVQVTPGARVDGEGILIAPSAAIPVEVGLGALLPLPPGAGWSVVSPTQVEVQPVGERWLWVQGKRAGVSDVLIEEHEQVPKPYTVTVGGAGEVPPGVHQADTDLTLVGGSQTTLTLPKAPVALLAARPSVLQAELDELDPRSLRLSAGRDGTAQVVVIYSDHTAHVWRVGVKTP